MLSAANLGGINTALYLIACIFCLIFLVVSISALGKKQRREIKSDEQSELNENSIKVFIVIFCFGIIYCLYKIIV